MIAPYKGFVKTPYQVSCYNEPVKINKGETRMRIYPTRIKNMRIDNNKTQAEIAEILGTSKNQVGKYERGEQDMNINHLVSLCSYYHVSADYILGLPEGLPYGHSRTRSQSK